MSLASKGGFDAVQMRAVAEQADVALGTLYRYFPSKIHLLVSALAEPIGLGDETGGFGWKQITGVIIGAVVMVLGLALMYVWRGEAKAPQPRT